MTQTSEVRTVNSRLAYLSDPGYPQTIADAAPYYFAKFEQQLAPVQGKYSTILDLIPADPTQLASFMSTFQHGVGRYACRKRRAAPRYLAAIMSTTIKTEVHRAYPSYSG
jgi:hypothetical protein